MLTRFWLWLLQRLGFNPHNLFVYFDGRRWRTADPLVVTRDFMTLPGFDWDEIVSQLRVANAIEQLHHVGNISRAVRKVLSIPEHADGGLTEIQCFDLFGTFRNLMGDVKKNGNLFPMSQTDTESPLLADLPIPTRPGGVYSSTSTDPSAVPPGSQEEPISG